MEYVVQGIRLVYGNRSYWPFVARPLLISSMLFIVIFAGGYFALVKGLQAWLHAMGGYWASAAGITGGSILYFVLWWFLAGIVFVTFATIASAFLWESLSHRVEEQVYGDSPRPKISLLAIGADAAMRMAHMSLMMCLSLTCFFIPFIGVIFMGWLCCHDYTAPAMMRRGILFHKQTPRVLKLERWPIYGLLCGIFTMIPFVNLFMMPAFVAAGTLMVADAEGKVRLAKQKV